ncbi:hypothetical protein, partial [Photorhabdus sp. S15-56]|uniref:hypothetical protein n=1 Tax=Photorhabdus sp. S15-56 TaxID=2029688 RepID=UPI001EFCBD50
GGSHRAGADHDALAGGLSHAVALGRQFASGTEYRSIDGPASLAPLPPAQCHCLGADRKPKCAAGVDG